MTRALGILAHLMTGILTLVAAVFLGLLTPSPRIVEVDSEALLRGFAAETREMDADAVAAMSPRFMDTVQALLDAYAAEAGVVVVDTNLALAGAQDLTGETLKAALSATLAGGKE